MEFHPCKMFDKIILCVCVFFGIYHKMTFHNREALLDVALNVHKAFGSCTSLHTNARRHSKLPTFCYILPDLSLEVVNHILSLDVMVRDEN